MSTINFNTEISENFTVESIHEFLDDARTDFANNHPNDELLFCVAAIGYDKDDDVTEYDDILTDWEPSKETVFEMCQREIANFKVDENRFEGEIRIEIVLEACYVNDEEGVNCFDDIVVATVNIQHRTRAEIIAEIIEYFENDTDAFTEVIEDCDDWDGYLEDDRWYSADDLEEILDGRPIVEILNMSRFGSDLDDWHYDSHNEKVFASFNPNRDWFRFDGYGNLESSNYKDYNDKIDHYAIEEIEENRGHLTSLDDYDELVCLFNELDEADE